MKERIDLSIIIPHYNTPELLKTLIDSIPDYSNIQTIVVDDNSDIEKDSLEKIFFNYKEKVEFYNNLENRSAGTCRNIGLEHAVGKWVLFADADDFFMQDMYSIVSDYFDSNYDIIFFTPTSILLGTEEISNRHLQHKKLIQQYLKNPNEENTLTLKAFRTGAPWSKMIKRELIEKYHIRFNSSRHWNDLYFSTVSGYYAKNIAASEKVIYCITKNKNSLTMNISEEAFDIRLEEFIKRCEFLLEHYGYKICKIHRVMGIGQLYTAVQQHYGIKKYIEIIRKFKRHHIPLFYLNTFNPFFLFENIMQRRKDMIQNMKI